MQNKQEYIRCRIPQLLIQYVIRIYSSYLEVVFSICNLITRNENFTDICFREACGKFHLEDWKEMTMTGFLETYTLNTLRTGDADLRFYITTVQDG